MKIIVNADDFGRDKKTTDAIVDCFLNHKITSTTLMVVHKDCQRASFIAREIGLPVGLHLCFDEGYPVADPAKIPSLLNEKGALNLTSKNLFRGKINLRELSIELMAQIKKIGDLGLQMTHIDSHHHLHCHPLVLPIFFQFRTYLPSSLKVRIPRNLEPCSILKTYGISKYIYKISAGFFLRRFFRTTDYFTSIKSYRDSNSFQFESVLAKVPRQSSSIEIMCHPGELDQYLFLMNKVDLESFNHLEFIDYSLL